MPFRLTLIITIACLVALSPPAHAQYCEDSIDVSTYWVGSLVYNPSANVVYGAGYQPGAFFAIDCSTNEVVASIPLLNALQVVHDSIDNKAYCIRCTSDDDSILVIDGSTHARIGVIPLYWANNMVWDPVANRLYVSEFEDNSVAVIDCVTDSVLAHVRTSALSMRMHLSTRHRKLYVQCNEAERLNIIDLNTLEVIKNIRLPGQPEAGCYSEAVDKYYCGAGLEVVVVDGSADTVVASITLLAERPRSAVSVESHALVMVGGGDSVHVVDATRDSVMRALPGVRSPYGLYWSETSDLVYCASSGWDQVAVIAGDGSRMLDVLQVGDCPMRFTAAVRHKRLYVGHSNSSKVYVIRDTVSGIAETPERKRAEPVRPTLLTRAQLQAGLLADPSLSLFDASGRLVLEPKSGVFFLQSAASTRRVVVAR